ncbi:MULTISPECIES: SMI1/KNR4 family protein [unclassified Natrinema]|uniref:SMI1/KNR4 family protein n=1 Tax=unclassified Natrinema TaxID=2622230 RepID=UPI00026D4479|nr:MULTISPECIES: SMI1/KNR4 family protein [unclassified Natrinema]AFO57614.1 hypothetical protein NJ7G_2381 [Natrinema sp. J7-2]
MITEMRDTGPPVTEEELESLETALGGELPEAYREFLREYNGGKPREASFEFADPLDGRSGASVNDFLGIRDDSRDIEACYDVVEHWIPDGLCPIAEGSGGDLVLLSIREDSEGEVFYIDHELPGERPFDGSAGDYPENTTRLAESFDDFLALLYDIDAPR